MNLQSMKKFNVLKDNRRMTFFFEDKERCKQVCGENTKILSEDTDYSFLEYIEKIYTTQHDILYDCRNREVLKIQLSYGVAYVRLFRQKSKKDSTWLYLDNLEYQIWNNNRFINPITWSIATPKEFYETFLQNNNLEFIEYSFRKYGQPKLSKPKELKGIKQSFSVDFIPKKCTCQCFVKDNDLWIKHRDYFSEELDDDATFDKPLEYSIKHYGLNSKKGNKFVYPDCWGSIVLRNEAWIVFKNIIPQLKLQSEYELKYDMLKKFCDGINAKYDDFLIGDWEKFFEKVVKELNKYVNIDNNKTK